MDAGRCRRHRPIVAVPTTAGTGSEVGRASVVTHEPTRTKKIIFHPKMLPSVVISDPAVTAGLPANITAWTGMDALAHNLEAYSSTYHHPLGDGIAVEGMRLVKEWLPRAVADGSDLEARAHMLAAASMGAIAFQKGLGAIHALSHPVGAIYDTHHGLTNAVFMPYVLAFNRSAVEVKLARAAAYIGLKDASFDGFLAWVLELRQQLKIPTRQERSASARTSSTSCRRWRPRTRPPAATRSRSARRNSARSTTARWPARSELEKRALPGAFFDSVALRQQPAADHLGLDLGCALEDVEDSGVAQHAADLVFQRIAVAAMDLQAGVGVAPGDAGG